MLFSSITFIYYFLPITLVLYFCIPLGKGQNPMRGKNSLLLLASFLFYAMGEPIYVFLMIASIVVGYVGGKMLACYPKKSLLAGFVGAQLSLLGIFKYTDFVINTWNQVTGMECSFLYLILPIGISFYSFQIISYLVDVYRQDMEYEKDMINFAAYITMFPQLIAGPIVRYEIVKSQMMSRQVSFANVNQGATRFLIGLGKKVLLADNIGELLLRIDQIQEKSVWTYWLVAIMYVLQLYHDFSGYSDMAIGLGKMLGFHFPENFDYPLMSRSITEFWRRWHISLGTFLRDYIYIPLKGSRCSTKRWIFNIMAVWFLSGLWHGASWNFVLWGLYFGAFLVLENLIKKRWKCPANVWMRGIQRIYTWMTVVISFVLFRFVELEKAKEYIVGMFTISETHVSCLEWYEYKNVVVLVAIGMIGATSLARDFVKCVVDRIEREKYAGAMIAVEMLFQIVMLIVVTAFLIQSSVHPFLYFRF